MTANRAASIRARLKQFTYTSNRDFNLSRARTRPINLAARHS